MALADEAICIGPAMSTESYLKIPNIIDDEILPVPINPKFMNDAE